MFLEPWIGMRSDAALPVALPARTVAKFTTDAAPLSRATVKEAGAGSTGW
jgi:hypothetical protein